MRDVARITVIAGVNGAGKSSVAGEAIRQRGGDYFNPDEVTRAIRAASPHLSDEQANSLAWHEGRRRLEEAVRHRAEHVFETTLGGSTITRLLSDALDSGLEVAVFYVGLESVELHLERVRSRVAAGGHPIPEDKVRERFKSSIENVVFLAPRLTELRVFDNSADADPKTGQRPDMTEVLYARSGNLMRALAVDECPIWASPVLLALKT